MNDEHDPDQQSMHEDGADTDHPVQAPVDDFSDASSSTEETATISQESTVEGDDTSAVVEETRSRSMLPIFVVIIGVLAIGGGFAYWHFGSSSSAPTIEQMMASKNTATPAVKLDTAPASTDVAAIKPAETTTGGAQAGANAPPPVAGSSAGADISNLKASDLPGAATSATTPTANSSSADAGGTASSALPVAGDPSSMRPPTIAPQNIAAPTPSAVPTASSAVQSPSSSGASAAQERIELLTSRVDELQKSLDQANKQLSQVTEAQSSLVTAAQNNPVMEERLTKIEQNLSQLESEKTHDKAHTNAAHSGVKKASTQVKTAPEHKHAIKSKKASKTQSATNVSAASMKASPSWVLRAATPGEAWVSADATSADLRLVHVGDSLPGVGKVKSINQSAKGWEIEGSEASVH